MTNLDFKTYSLHKAVVVTAAPMTRGDYWKHKQIEPACFEQESVNDEGYIVRYPESKQVHEYSPPLELWKSKETFEKTYSPVGTNESGVPDALAVISAAMRTDVEFARTWFSNIAMMAIAAGASPDRAKKAALQFMTNAFGASAVTSIEAEPRVLNDTPLHSSSFYIVERDEEVDVNVSQKVLVASIDPVSAAALAFNGDVKENSATYVTEIGTAGADAVPGTFEGAINEDALKDKFQQAMKVVSESMNNNHELALTWRDMIKYACIGAGGTRDLAIVRANEFMTTNFNVNLSTSIDKKTQFKLYIVENTGNVGRGKLNRALIACDDPCAAIIEAFGDNEGNIAVDHRLLKVTLIGDATIDFVAGCVMTDYRSE